MHIDKSNSVWQITCLSISVSIPFKDITSASNIDILCRLQDVEDAAKVNTTSVRGNIDHGYYIKIYGGIIVSLMISAGLQAVLYSVSLSLSGRRLHASMFASIMHLPIRFFDTNASGKMNFGNEFTFSSIAEKHFYSHNCIHSYVYINNWTLECQQLEIISFLKLLWAVSVCWLYDCIWRHNVYLTNFSGMKFVVGQILNKFSRDTEFMDTQLPVRMQLVFVVSVNCRHQLNRPEPPPLLN